MANSTRFRTFLFSYERDKYRKTTSCIIQKLMERYKKRHNQKFKANSLNHSTPSPPAPGPRKITNAAAWILIPESWFSLLLTGLKFDQYDTGWKNNYQELPADVFKIVLDVWQTV